MKNVLPKFKQWFMLLFIIPASTLASFGQHLGLFGEGATATLPELKNHRGLGLMYLKVKDTGLSWQLSVSKGYSSFTDYQGDLFYGNRIAVNIGWLKPILGNTRNGLFFGGGLGLDSYYATQELSSTLNPGINLVVHYQETDLFNSRFGMFFNAKPKASISLEYLFGCYDCYTPYGDPMLLLEVNAGIMYNLSKKDKRNTHEK